MIYWALTIISLVGNYLNCKKIKMCFIIWIICNIGWLVIDVKTGVLSRAILDGVQIGFSCFGYQKWAQAEEGHGK